MQHKNHVGHYHTLYTLCIIGFIFALHITIPSYINSSFLRTFMSEDMVGILYMIASIAGIFGYLFFHKAIKTFKTYPTLLTLTILQLLLLFGITLAPNGYVAGFLFVFILLFTALIGFVVDIIVESCSNHTNAGRMWGIYYTAFNFGWILGPLIAPSLIGASGNYNYIYIAAACILLPFIYIVHKNFRHFHDVRYSSLTTHETWKKVMAHPDLSKIFIINVFLNTFYAWMTIYTPIYLHKELGFGWDDIGLIFTFMLLPFIILEIPLGKLADKKWGEKELMIAGFAIMGISTMTLSYIPQHSLGWWAAMLFITRIGAATAELMIETYFFKHIRQRDANILSVFRITRPMSNFVAPVISLISLFFVPHQYTFIVLGVFLLSAIIICSQIKDTN